MLTALEPRVEINGGLGDLPRRLRERPCTIAYLGASVTAQSDGYRTRLHEAIGRRTGQEHLAVAAGVGSVGSISGVFLMDDLVLAHDPDLCLVEFTTTDLGGETPPEAVEPAVEGIVLKLRDAGCAACLLHLYRADMPAGEDDPVLAAYARVARRHAIPLIDVAGALRERVGSGALAVPDLVRDHVHTTPAGSDLVADAVDRGLARIEASEPGAAPAPEAPHPDSFHRARLVAARTDMALDPARAREGRFRFVRPYVEVAPGNPLRATFAGELVGLVAIVGPSSGWVRVTAGENVQDVLLWDPWCHYDRLDTAVLQRRCPPGAEVTLESAEAPVDMSEARRPVDPGTARDRLLRVVWFMVRA